MSASVYEMLIKHYLYVIFFWGLLLLFIPLCAHLIARKRGKQPAQKVSWIIYGIFLTVVLFNSFPNGVIWIMEMPMYPQTQASYRYFKGSLGNPAYTSMSMKIDGDKRVAVTYLANELAKKNWYIGGSFTNELDPNLRYSIDEILEQSHWSFGVHKIDSNNTLIKTGQMTIASSQDNGDQVLIEFTFH